MGVETFRDEGGKDSAVGKVIISPRSSQRQISEVVVL